MSKRASEAVFDNLSLSNVNSLWGAFAAEALVRLGVGTVVVSPGSRSTPLTFACARHAQIECIPVLDERTAGFFALGIARRTQRTVALLCTSGTAAANYLPAVVEASESGIPLLVMTADRPAELRHCHAGQTIDQVRLYGNYPRFQAELSLPGMERECLVHLRRTLQLAAERCCFPDPGPVHLNFPFREPLQPQARVRLALDDDPEQLLEGLTPPRKPALVAEEIPALSGEGVIIAGPCQPVELEAFVNDLGQVAKKLGWPVLCDALNPARHWEHAVPHLIAGYDVLLRNEQFVQAVRPEQVVVIGELPTSKGLRRWLSGLDGVPVYILNERPENFDSVSSCSQHMRVGIAAFSNSVVPNPRDCREYLDTWKRAERWFQMNVGTSLDASAPLFESRAHRLMSDYLPEGAAIFFASSMPVRDAEYFWRKTNRRYRPFFNRGANGIDGTLATAMGVAHRGEPTVLVTGDLAFLHDHAALLLKGTFEGTLTIVLIDNGGGGIFNHLPIAQFDQVYERYFATPQQVAPSAICAAHGVEVTQIDTWDDFLERLKRPAEGLQVIELRTDRAQDAARRRNLFDRLTREIRW